MSLISTVELVQVVGQARVVNGGRGSGLEVGDLPEPSPDSSKVINRELVF